MIVVDPWHWMDEEGGFPEEPSIRRNAILVAQCIEYGGPLRALHGVHTLIPCRRRPGGTPCRGFLFVVKTDKDELHAFCPTCGIDEFLIHNWQETDWAEGPMEPIPVKAVPREEALEAPPLPAVLGVDDLTHDEWLELGRYLSRAAREPRWLDAVHGILSSVVVAPEPIPSSAWLPLVFGEDSAELFETMDELQRALELVMQLHNSIIRQLDTGTYVLEQPLASGGRRPFDLRTWCDGFWTVVELCEDIWAEHAGDVELRQLVSPLLTFSDDSLFPSHGVDGVRPAPEPSVLAGAVRGLRDYWREANPDGWGLPSQPSRRSRPKIGRNAPCPCGSGKKYKHCCLGKLH